jgi:hypothetical protein
MQKTSSVIKIVSRNGPFISHVGDKICFLKKETLRKRLHFNLREKIHQYFLRQFS